MGWKPMGHEPKTLEFAGDRMQRVHGRPLAKPAQRRLAMRSRLLRGIGSLCTSLLVMAGFCLVHGVSPDFRAFADEKAAVTRTAERAAIKERAFHGALPPNVIEMREQILSAVQAGDVDELKSAIEWNEIQPDFGTGANEEPLAHWKRISADGKGHEVLAILANVLALPPARLALGRDPENTFVYVWPYLAELPLDSLTPSEEVDLYRLMPVAEANAMRTAKKWSWWRVAIGADGTWHTFRKYN